MVLTKVVVTPQGQKKIDLSLEEETATLLEWENNTISKEKRMADEAVEKAKKVTAMDKIYAIAGLTAEEKLLLTGKK